MCDKWEIDESYEEWAEGRDPWLADVDMMLEVAEGQTLQYYKRLRREAEREQRWLYGPNWDKHQHISPNPKVGLPQAGTLEGEKGMIVTCKPDHDDFVTGDVCQMTTADRNAVRLRVKERIAGVRCKLEKRKRNIDGT